MNRTAFSIAGLVGLGIVIGLLISSGPAVTAARGQDPEKLTALRKERREILRQALKATENGYQNGVIEFVSVMRITANLLNAELDLASDHDERVAIRKRAVEQLKVFERTARERADANLATNGEVLEVKADRLQAEIDLLREIHEGK
jgi:outer membrane protein TolC